MNTEGSEAMTSCHGLNFSHRLWETQSLSRTNYLGNKSCSRSLGTNCPQVSNQDSEHGQDQPDKTARQRNKSFTS